MKIDEAIKELTPLLDEETTPLTYCETQATKLAIEALKRDQHNRRINNHPDQAKLPGEDTDDP